MCKDKAKAYEIAARVDNSKFKDIRTTERVEVAKMAAWFAKALKEEVKAVKAKKEAILLQIKKDLWLHSK